MKIPVLVFGLSLVITSSAIEDPQANFIVTIILSILLGICIFIVMLLLIVSYSRIQAEKKHAFKVMENIQAHIQETYSYYQRKDLVWTICKYGDLMSMRFDTDERKEPIGHHIELWKYDSMQDQPNEHHEPQQQRHQQDFRRSAVQMEEFEFNIDALKFTNIYSPLWTDDQVSFEEVKQFLDLATPSFLQYNQSIDSIWQVGKRGAIGYVLLQIFNFVWAWDRVDRIYLALGSFIYVIIATITMLCYIRNWYRKDGAIVPNIQAIIEQTDFQLNAKGFRWALSERYFKSVLLWKDVSPQMEPFQDLEMQAPGQLPAPVQLKAHMYEVLENKDEEISEGLESAQTQDNLSLLGQNAGGQDVGSQHAAGQNAGRDSVLEFLRQQMDIVFYYDKKFLTHHYFPGLTANKVSTVEITTFLNEIESRFALYRGTCFGRFFRAFKFILYFVAFVAFIFFFSCVPYPPGLLIVACLMPVFVILALVWGCLFHVHCSRMEKQISEVILQRASEYEQKGLKWVIPDKKYPPALMLRDKNATMEPYILT